MFTTIYLYVAITQYLIHRTGQTGNVTICIVILPARSCLECARSLFLMAEINVLTNFTAVESQARHVIVSFSPLQYRKE